MGLWLQIYAVMEQVLVHCVLKDRTVYAHLCQLMLCATLEVSTSSPFPH